ncbi:hypothetical protein [Pseudoalteromonas luteoviolacea]|uniref:Uncharacterized protein n=1 Tax=Pseudoalteromonas luteoviolacea S4060-1 TaxID=1365257 RepID=A0A161YNK0_9GAMM|nr:hypothetical protein [Pseudoalteromonas luteoviolacea]KZN63389.1 hypothetical protein N478_03810 [Pseudoalteromonas luteoviolacea S4060-1]
MKADLIHKITKVNKDVSEFKKQGIHYGLISDEFLIGTHSDSEVYTFSALELLSAYDEGAVINKFDEDGDEALFYILIKVNREVVYESFSLGSEINFGLLKTAFLRLLAIGRKVNLFTNIPCNENDDVFSLGFFELPSSINVNSGVVEGKLTVSISSLKEIDKTYRLKQLAVACSVLLFGFVYVLLGPEEKEQEVQVVEVKKTPYKVLKSFYTKNSVEPYSILSSFYRQINRFKMVDGWVLTGAYLKRLEDTGEVVEFIKLTSSFGKMKALEEIVLSSGYSIDVESNKAILSRTVEKNSLYDSYHRFHVGSFQNWLSSYFQFYFEDTVIKTKELKVKSSENNVTIKQSDVEIPNVYSSDIISVAGGIRGYPFSLESLKFEIQPNKMFTLNISLVTAGVTNGN